MKNTAFTEPRKKKGEGGGVRKGWVVVGLILSVVVLFVSHLGLKTFFASSYFDIKEIRWRGVNRMDPQELNGRFESVLGTSLISLDIDKVHADLLTYRWVKEAVVRKILPNRLDIMITERIPAAVELDPARNKMILRDDEGVVLEDGGEKTGDLPRLIHYTPPAYKKALGLAPLLVSRDKAVIDLSSADDLRVRLAEGSVLHFGDQDYQKRWERFIQVEADVKRRHGTTWEADLRFPEKVVVRKKIVPS